MILTNKTKADFLSENKWIEELMFHEVDEVYLNALIFEWFDKKDIHIVINFETIDDSEKAFTSEVLYFIPEGKDRKKDVWDFYEKYHYSFECMDWFKTRREAIIDGIKHADKLYNKKFG